MHFVWQPWNIKHCARHGVTPALAEAVILAEDFTHEPQPGGIRAIGHGTVNGVCYKVVFQRGEPDEISSPPATALCVAAGNSGGISHD